jgi:hypothetical protein
LDFTQETKNCKQSSNASQPKLKCLMKYLERQVVLKKITNPWYFSLFINHPVCMQHQNYRKKLKILDENEKFCSLWPSMHEKRALSPAPPTARS